MAVVEGKAGIKATVLKDSISEAGIRFTTWEIETPRIIWAELLTHGMLVRNASSSRAIPFAKMVEQLKGQPVRYGQANPGMQDKGVDFDASVIIPEYLYDAIDAFLVEKTGAHYLTHGDLFNDNAELEMTATGAWQFHKFLSVGIAGAMNNAKLHKQVYNRLTEAHQMIKGVVSGTEVANFFWLRKHDAADPTLDGLAQCMYDARKQSVPQMLKAGEWHLPYLDEIRDNKGKQQFYLRAEAPLSEDSIGLATPLTLEQAIKVSCARTGAVSYRNEDYGIEQSLRVYDRLINSDRVHASATQHAATPMQKTIKDGCGAFLEVNDARYPATWEPGVSHADRDGQLWSAQLRGWIMFRKLIPNENYTGEI